MMILLRLIHIVGAIFWVGSAMFTGFFLIPALKESPATMGQVGQALSKRGFMTVMPIVGLLVILSGATMLWVTSGGNMQMYMQTPAGHTFTMAGGVGILSLLIGLIFTKPANMKVGQLGAQLQAATDPAEKARLGGEMAAAGKQAALWTLIVTILMIIAAAGMAIARYV
ncbi:MAG: hypothetical protein JF590_07980 [Gemmatimonadetes bacterium]|nr:hypothetical protein [Gemmatimonadota bacterium]